MTRTARRAQGQSATSVKPLRRLTDWTCHSLRPHGLRADRRAPPAPRHRPRLRAAGGRARRRGARPYEGVPLRNRREARRARADGHPVPGGLRRRRRRHALVRARGRGAGAGRLVGLHHDGRPHLPGHDADSPLGDRRAEGRLAARPLRRAQARRLRADRAGGGLRRGGHPHPRGAGRRRVGDRRREAVHHQRRHGNLGLRDDHRRDGRPGTRRLNNGAAAPPRRARGRSRT